MKKSNLLFLLPCLALGLASCGPEGESSSAEADLATLAEGAISQVCVAYNSFAATGVTSSQTLYGSTTVNDDNDNYYTFNFTYSVAAAEGEDASAFTSTVSITDADSDGNYKLKVSPGDTDDLYTITINAFYEGTQYATGTFNCKVLMVTGVRLSEIYEMSSGSVTFYGYYMGAYNYGSSDRYRYFGDGEFGMLAFMSSSQTIDATVGNLYMVTATVSPYNGLWEVDSATVTAVEESDIPEKLMPDTPVDLHINSDNHPTWTTDAESAVTYQNRKVYVEGAKVTDVSGSVGANLTYTVEVGGTSYTIYEHSTYCAGDLYDSFTPAREEGGDNEVLRVGDIISFYGWGSAYNNPQIIGAMLTKWEDGGGGAVLPTAITIENLLKEGVLENGPTYIVQGYVTGWYQGSQSAGIFIQDGDYATLLYGYSTDIEGLAVGVAVEATGTGGWYNGVVQLATSAVEVVTGDDITCTEASGPITLTSGKNLTLADNCLLATGSGTVTSVDSFGNVYVNVNSDDEDDTVEIYMQSSKMGDNVYNSWDGVATGDTISFSGWVNEYNKNLTISDLRDGANYSNVEIVNAACTAHSSTAEE